MSKEIRYLVFINIGGGLHPIEKLHSQEKGVWYDKDGKFNSDGKTGWETIDGNMAFQFTTKSLKDAKLVYEGAKNFSRLLKNIIK